jgi:hypothetical protein
MPGTGLGISRQLEAQHTGLLLLKCPNSQSTYQMVGVFSLAKVDKNESSFSALEAGIKNLAWFENVEPQVITII